MYFSVGLLLVCISTCVPLTFAYSAPWRNSDNNHGDDKDVALIREKRNDVDSLDSELIRLKRAVGSKRLTLFSGGQRWNSNKMGNSDPALVREKRFKRSYLEGLSHGIVGSIGEKRVSPNDDVGLIREKRHDSIEREGDIALTRQKRPEESFDIDTVLIREKRFDSVNSVTSFLQKGIDADGGEPSLIREKRMD